MKIYLVGGAVRDELLELPVKERDWLVVGATAEEMLALGYTQIHGEFPVFLHPETGEEYSLARTETKVGPGYRGFSVYAGPDVTLEQDLKRRDLTINALAQDEAGNLVDLFNGEEDLQEGLLRHVSPAFVEDPVRLLRIARFAAKLGRWGFRIAHGTHGLMRKMAASDDLLTLTPQRISQEMWKALGEPQPWRFFESLHRCGVLVRLMPELAALLGPAEGHGSEVGQESLKALQRAAKLSDDPLVRWLAVMHHPVAQCGRIPDWLYAGKTESALLGHLQELDCWTASTPNAAEILTALHTLKPIRQTERYVALTQACTALWPESSAAMLRRLELARVAEGTVTAKSFVEQGVSGASLGGALQLERSRLLDELLRAEGLLP